MTTKRDREAPELMAACIRMMRALARRAGQGELEALESLDMLQDVLQHQLGSAVISYREGPAQASWADIGKALGMSRQAAQQRWGSAADLLHEWRTQQRRKGLPV